MPSESFGGNGSEGTSGASSAARGGSDGGDSYGSESPQSSFRSSEIAQQVAADTTPAESPQSAFRASEIARQVEQTPSRSEYNQYASPASNPAAAVHDLTTTTGEYKNGISYGELAARQEAGFGGDDASPGQTVDQALAAKDFHDFANSTVPSIAMGFIGGVSPALSAALRIAMASQTNTMGEAIGISLGSFTGVPAIGSVGALLGRAFDTGKAPTASDVASLGWRSVSNAIGSEMAKAGYSAAGPFGAAAAKAVSTGATGAIGNQLGFGGSNAAQRGTTSSITGGTR